MFVPLSLSIIDNQNIDDGGGGGRGGRHHNHHQTNQNQRYYFRPTAGPRQTTIFQHQNQYGRQQYGYYRVKRTNNSSFYAHVGTLGPLCCCIVSTVVVFFIMLPTTTTIAPIEMPMIGNRSPEPSSSPSSLPPPKPSSPNNTSDHHHNHHNNATATTTTKPAYRAFKGGQDIDGAQLFICRTHRHNQVIPGKYSQTLKKCSIGYNRREAQFHQFEILIEEGDMRYEWHPLQAPVIKLPDNALLGGMRPKNLYDQFDIEKFQSKLHGNHKSSLSSSSPSSGIIDQNGQLNSTVLEMILNTDLKRFKTKRLRRHRRSIHYGDDNNDDDDNHNHVHQEEWSRNWRGNIRPFSHHHRFHHSSSITLKAAASNSDTFELRKFQRKPLRINRIKPHHMRKPKRGNSGKTGDDNDDDECTPKLGSSSSWKNGQLSSSSNNKNCNDNVRINESVQQAKNGYYIARCTLRTGNIISEQIGKIWWNQLIGEWIASFPFGGHEIYCFDYSILTIADSSFSSSSS